MRSTTLVLLLALSTATPAMAGRWVTIADGSTRAVHLDTAGIQREGAQTRAWVREVHTREQRSEQAGVLSVRVTYQYPVLKSQAVRQITIPISTAHTYGVPEAR